MLVLSTRKITGEEERTAKKMGFELNSFPLLRFDFPEPVAKELEAIEDLAPDAWAFTSKNGVEGFMRAFEQGMVPLKPKKIFAVGKQTAARLQEFEFEAESADPENGVAMAHLIAADESIRSVVHFCGNLRREELSTILREHGVMVSEVVVYRTIPEMPENKPPEEVKAVLFYSPSAVENAGNLLSQYRDIPWVSIGSTTAAALRKKREEEILEAEEASTESMLRTLKTYLSKNGRR